MNHSEFKVVCKIDFQAKRRIPPLVSLSLVKKDALFQFLTLETLFVVNMTKIVLERVV